MSQDELLLGILQGSQIPMQERDLFQKLPQSSVRLSELRDIFNRKQPLKAIRLLEHRSRIHLDSKLIIKPEDDMLLWDMRHHHLDFAMMVSGEIGLWATIPNVDTDHTFSFKLNLSQPQRVFKNKYGKLGFDPKGRMLYIGQCRNDNVWLAFCPWATLDKAADDVEAGYCTGDTRLSTAHYRMAIMFLAKALSALPDRGYTLDADYDVDLSGPSPDFFLTTNIMYVNCHAFCCNHARDTPLNIPRIVCKPSEVFHYQKTNLSWLAYKTADRLETIRGFFICRHTHIYCWSITLRIISMLAAVIHGRSWFFLCGFCY